MSAVTRTTRPARTAAAAAAVGFAGIALFQAALAAGAPLGHAAWGGAHAHLSSSQRIGSGVAVLVWMAAALVVLGRAGVWSAGRHALLFRRGTWFLAGVSVLAAIMNLASQSRWENAIFGPLAIALAVLCTIVARSGPDGQPRTRNTATAAPPH